MSSKAFGIGCILLILVLAAAVYASQSREPAQSSQIGRYQLVVYSNTLCKMDTSSGQIWVLTSGMERQFAPLLQGMGLELQWRELEELYDASANDAESR